MHLARCDYCKLKWNCDRILVDGEAKNFCGIQCMRNWFLRYHRGGSGETGADPPERFTPIASITFLFYRNGKGGKVEEP